MSLDLDHLKVKELKAKLQKAAKEIGVKNKLNRGVSFTTIS